MLSRARRAVRALAAIVLVVVALGALLGKGALEARGPYLEALPDHPFCLDAEWALADDRVADALELAEAGGCGSALERARARWDALSDEERAAHKAKWHEHHGKFLHE